MKHAAKKRSSYSIYEHHGSPSDIVSSLPFYAVLLLFIGLMTMLAGFWTVRASFIQDTPQADMQSVPMDIEQVSNETTASAEIRVPILLYHYVEHLKDPKDSIRRSLTISPETFESQIMTLIHDGYTFLTVSDLVAAMRGHASLPAKPIVLTFDDGHWDLATDVLPILNKYHVQATAYIISGFIGQSDFLSDAQLREVINSGLVEIGSHTVHHLQMAKLPGAQLSDEVRISKQHLERTYKLHIVSFAYPSGSFDQAAINMVRQTGYQSAVSTIPGVQQSESNRYFLARIRPGAKTGKELLQFLAQDQFNK